MAINTGPLSSIELNQLDDFSHELLAEVLSRAEALVTGYGWLDSTEALLKEIGTITQVSRVWIFQTLELNNDYILQDYVFEWTRDDKYIQIGLPHFNHFKSNIDNQEYSVLVESRKKGEYQTLITDNLPQSWLKSYLQSQKILSMLTIPIIVDNQWWGTLGLDDCERAFEWSATEIALLKAASFFISSAITREHLVARKRQLSVLKQNTTCSTWEFDLRRGHLWSTSEVFLPECETPFTMHFVSRDWIRRLHPDFRQDFFHQAKRFLNQQDEIFRCVVKMLINNGECRWIEISANSPKIKNHKDDVLVGVFWDITQRKETELRLELEATTDPLTGLFNRRKFEQEVESALVEIEQSDRYFSLAIIDIDFFKQINDTYGHIVGDKVLCYFTLLCQQSLRDHDCFARIGGEEFALLLKDTSEDEAFAICTRIRELVKANHYMLEQTGITFTISIGCTTVRDKSVLIEHAFEKADTALYQAKLSGRDQVIAI
ncbi:hypothetical protein TW81_09250 [Vibrio galatheae]|uniref:diguanylate cyclase n=1 Tax=Vibrio galatheae TaxID=579748 RepID=A0A0F4NM80_9VIBR|nr:diguanylate cyclase [Vibrio galatheae]KJY83186.1 hypothetical protein TW81_09250 [Vibrio galatheae]